MNRLLLMCCFCIIAHLSGASQNALPPSYQLQSDTAAWTIISPANWQLLEDKGGKLTIADVVVLPSAAAFHYRNQQPTNTAVNTYWFRYAIKNTMAAPAGIALNSISQFDDFYVLQPGGNWQHYASGAKRNWDRKDGLKLSDCIPVIIQPNDSLIVYQRSYNAEKGLFPEFEIVVISTDKMVNYRYVDFVETEKHFFTTIDLFPAIILGLVLAAFFFNLFFYRVVKEKMYLYFALYALFAGIKKIYELTHAYYNLHYSLEWEYIQLIGYLWGGFHYFFIEFISISFKIKERYKWWDRWLHFLATTNFIWSLSYPLSILFSVNLHSAPDEAPQQVLLMLISVTILITFGLVARGSGKTGRLLLIAALPYTLLNFIDNIFFVFSDTQPLSPFVAVYENSHYQVELFSFATLIICFSWILFIRYSNLLKENARQALDNERLAKEKEIERNELISLQKIELERQVAERTSELKQSLEDLKATQGQLIQSEKMASLGELTAGIAHEIQNPLNFVNNFSEVSNELIDEMNEELNKGDIEEAKFIANDIKQNLQKINHHGKRADAIVKGMLQHSRSTSATKEPTDINKLADEYLRLAYHGLRAKDKSFNATLNTDFDERIAKINIIPQDIGRVILNTITNSFYAVQQKKNQVLTGYEPTVSVSTQKVDGKVLIGVKDNGNGIPQNIVGKIFQPFFTTKPTGQGTGLGLSLAYDIIKAHGGQIKVETQEGEGTTFVITLPAS